MRGFIGRLRLRILNSLAFRSGFRLVPHNDLRATELPDMTELQPPYGAISALYSGQIQYDADCQFIDRMIPIIECANRTNLSAVEARIPDGHEAKGAVNHWPGTHYRLLAALVKIYQPRTVIEIGTYRGLGYLSLGAYLEPDSSLITFDVMPFNRIAGALLKSDDFIEGKRLQIIDDMTDESTFLKYVSLFRKCDLLFLDGPKNGIFEYRFRDYLLRHGLKKGCLVVVDDIRLPAMLEFWNSIRMPKLDLISFGHYTGTGIFWWT